MAGDTRNRMIEATVSALQRHGVAGMSFTDVLRASGAARGGIYHHFPGGKLQLVAEAADSNARQVHERLAALQAGSPRSIVEEFLALIRPVVQAAACGSGCAVAAVTVDAGQDSDDLRRVADSAFTTWTGELAERLAASGLPPPEARDLATTLITLLEGAQVLCRASGTLDPFERVVRTIASLPLEDLAGQEASLVMIRGNMSLTRNKLVVTTAIDAILGARDLDAIDRFFAVDYIQHSATGADGPGALRELLGGMPEEFRYERVRILGDGDLVACHGVYYGAEEWPLAGFDVFRIADGKLAEHWDNHQRLAGRGMLDGPAEVTQPEQTEATRAVVNAFVDGMLVAGVDPAGLDWIEHSSDWTGRGYRRRHFTVAEGEFALTGSATGADVCYDLFRVADGQIAEHWAVISPVPAVIRHANGLFLLRTGAGWSAGASRDLAAGIPGLDAAVRFEAPKRRDYRCTECQNSVGNTKQE